MTMILHAPNGFGRYRPDAEFVDEVEKLRAEFDRTASAEQTENYDVSFFDFRKKNRLVTKHATERAKSFQRFSQLTLEFRVKDYADLMMDGLLMVSAPIMEIVERLEPDVHQFWPIDFRTRGGKVVSDTSYYAMLVLQSRDAFRPEESIEGSVFQTGSYSPHWHIHGHKRALLEGVAIDASATNGAHLWYEPRILSEAYFLSDELGMELKKQGFKLPPKFY